MNTYFKEIRELNNKTQQEVAEVLNVSPQSVSKWENGISLPSVEFLPRLANIYSCSISAFFKESELDLYKRFYSLNDKECLKYIFEVIRNGNPHLKIPNNVNEKCSYPLESFFSKQLYEYLKSAEIFSIKDLQKCLKTEFSQVILIVHSLFYLGIVSPSDNQDTYDFRKDKLDIILPYCKDNLENDSLGILFKRLRVHFHETQKSIAKLVNVSPQAVGKWERGLSLPSVEILLRLAAHYGCSIESFFSLYEYNFYTAVFSSLNIEDGIFNLKLDEIIDFFYNWDKEELYIDFLGEGRNPLMINQDDMDNPIFKSIYEMLKKQEINTEVEDKKIENLAFEIGKDNNDNTVVIDLKKTPNILIYGQQAKECLIKNIMDRLNNYAMKSKKHLKIVTINSNVAKSDIRCIEYGHLWLEAAAMETIRRKELFKKEGVKDIDEYNNLHFDEPLKRFVIVISEFADLMKNNNNGEIESFVSTIANYSRKGIHLILITQVPTVDVITGIIKANMSVKIAFKTRSKIESRIVLDNDGAEMLDDKTMLYITHDMDKPISIRNV